MKILQLPSTFVWLQENIDMENRKKRSDFWQPLTAIDSRYGSFRPFRGDLNSFSEKRFCMLFFCSLFPTWQPFDSQFAFLSFFTNLYFVEYKTKTTIFGGFSGAANRIWTGDLVLTKDVLYLLSHSSIWNFLPILEGFGDPVSAACYSLPRTCSCLWALSRAATAANATSVSEYSSIFYGIK